MNLIWSAYYHYYSLKSTIKRKMSVYFFQEGICFFLDWKNRRSAFHVSISYQWLSIKPNGLEKNHFKVIRFHRVSVRDYIFLVHDWNTELINNVINELSGPCSFLFENYPIDWKIFLIEEIPGTSKLGFKPFQIIPLLWLIFVVLGKYSDAGCILITVIFMGRILFTRQGIGEHYFLLYKNKKRAEPEWSCPRRRKPNGWWSTPQKKAMLKLRLVQYWFIYW